MQSLGHTPIAQLQALGGLDIVTANASSDAPGGSVIFYSSGVGGVTLLGAAPLNAPFPLAAGVFVLLPP
jgi:hypothetical protein